MVRQRRCPGIAGIDVDYLRPPLLTGPQDPFEGNRVIFAALLPMIRKQSLFLISL